MARCKKPCPGCGEIDQFRNANSVCCSCEEIISKGIELKKETKKLRRAVSKWCSETNRIPVRIPDARYWPDNTLLEKKYARAMAVSFRQLINAISEGGIVRVATPDRGVPPFSMHYGDICDYRLLKEEEADALDRLHRALIRAIYRAYIQGIKHGRNLLMQIAKGEMSFDHIDKHTLDCKDKLRQHEAYRGN